MEGAFTGSPSMLPIYHTTSVGYLYFVLRSSHLISVTARDISFFGKALYPCIAVPYLKIEGKQCDVYLFTDRAPLKGYLCDLCRPRPPPINVRKEGRKPLL